MPHRFLWWELRQNNLIKVTIMGLRVAISKREMDRGGSENLLIDKTNRYGKSGPEISHVTGRSDFAALHNGMNNKL